MLALGVAGGARYRDEDLRYERIIIMTDADVDGAHIASLLITFFWRTMPQMVRSGRLFLALPAALSPQRRRQDRIREATTPTRTNCSPRPSRGRRSRSAGSRASAK